jgi:hypothetical protein
VEVIGYWQGGPMRKALAEGGFRPTGVNLRTRSFGTVPRESARAAGDAAERGCPGACQYAELVQHRAVKTMQRNEAARSPREVAAAVESTGEVRLERRGGEVPFVIMREDRTRQIHDAMVMVGRLIRNVVAHGELDELEALLVDTLPWARFLPEQDCTEFAREFVWTIEACSDLDVWAPFGRMLHQWQQTATIHADPALAEELSRALDADLGPVLSPTQEDARAEAE